MFNKLLRGVGGEQGVCVEGAMHISLPLKIDQKSALKKRKKKTHNNEIN